MIEGSLSDVSLPGLLQFLATESNKSFKVSIVNGGQKGDLFVCDGEILSANYGLLEGNDALTELLFWPEGRFEATLITEAERDQVKGNLKIILRQVNTFADQMGYLRESQVGLNTEIVPSLSFGTQAWQEALAKQPLFKEDYAVLGWITDGRTMRQAMREFNFDVVRATSALFRLLSTGSVEVLRPTMSVNVDDAGGETPLSGLAAILDSMQPAEPESVYAQTESETLKSSPENGTFDASPQAQDQERAQDQDHLRGQEHGGRNGAFKARDLASLEVASTEIASSEVASSESVSSAIASSGDAVIEDASPEVVSAQSDSDQEFGRGSEDNVTRQSRSKDVKHKESEVVPGPAKEIAKSGHGQAADLIHSLNMAQSNEYNDQSGTTTGTTLNAVSGTMETTVAASTTTAQDKSINARDSDNEDKFSSREVITSDSLPAVGSAEFNEIMAKAQRASEHPLDHDSSSAATSQAVTTQITLPTSFRTSSDKIAAVSSPLHPESIPIAKAAALARQSLEAMVPKTKEPVDSVGAWAVAVRGSESKLPNGGSISAQAPASISAQTSAQTSVPASASSASGAVSSAPAPEESPERRLFDIVRTDPLPIVAIDIERLFQTSFHVSPFGHISLGNDVLEADLQKILQDFKQGKNFITVATEEEMLPAQVLHYCKYCLERGYIDPPDAVVSLTADLLLGRVELEQYLLQRRRITGDELRDVIDVARQKGIKLTDLLVKLGFMTASDWDRLCQEKERFARR